jgi:hypothetical protein
MNAVMGRLETLQHRYTGTLRHQFRVNGYRLQVNDGGTCGTIAQDGEQAMNLTDYYCALCASNRGDGKNGNHDGEGPCEHKKMLSQAREALGLA